MVPICTVKCKPFRDPLDSIEDIHSTRCVQRLGDQSHNTWNNHSKYAGSKNAERWYVMCTGSSIKKPCALPKANGFLICYIQIYLCWGLTICDWNSEHSPSIWSKVWKWWSAGLAAARLWMRRICQDCHMAATELPWLKTRWISFCFRPRMQRLFQMDLGRDSQSVEARFSGVFYVESGLGQSSLHAWRWLRCRSLHEKRQEGSWTRSLNVTCAAP